MNIFFHFSRLEMDNLRYKKMGTWKNKRHERSPVRRKDVAEVLKMLKKDSRDVKEINGIFQKAIKDKDFTLIRVLLSNGVKIEALNEANQTAIHFAIEHDCPKALNLLFSHCNNNINYTDNNGLSHFHIACITGHASMVKYFVDNGVDLNVRFRSGDHDERNDFTPLLFAVKYGQLEIAQLLLERGCDPNAPDFFGRTPLHLVAGIPEILGDLILAKKINAFHKTDDSHAKAIAFQTHTLEVLELLVKHGADVNATDRRGDSPLSYVFHDETANYVEKKFLRNSLDFRIFSKVFSAAKLGIMKRLKTNQMRKIKLLLEHGASVALRNDNDDTVLHYAINDLKSSRQLGDLAEPYFDDSVTVDVVESILKCGADVDARNKDGQTPLQIAVSVLSADVVDVLLGHGADVNGVEFDHEVDGYFHYPNVLPCLEATENLIEIVDMLASKGFDFSQTDHLAVLKFFICNNVGCRYADPEDENASYKLQNLLEFGTNANIETTLDKISRESRYLRGMISDHINKYLMKLQISELCVSERIEDCLRCRILRDSSEITQRHLDEYEEEAKQMKLTMLSNDKCLTDVPITQPDRFYLYLKNSNYKEILRSGNFDKMFHHNGGIIKGYFAKSLVRRFVVKSTNDYLRSLIDVGLPDPCCEKISSYLNNEDLWSLCLATVK